jgi:hypothetical protein
MDFGAFADYEADLEQILNGVAEKLEGEAVSLRGGKSGCLLFSAVVRCPYPFFSYRRAPSSLPTGGT